MLQTQLKFYHYSGSSNSESQLQVLTFQVHVQVQVQVLKKPDSSPTRVQVQDSSPTTLTIAESSVSYQKWFFQHQKSAVRRSASRSQWNCKLENG